MRFRFTVAKPVTIAGRDLQPGDVIDCDTESQDTIVAVRLPFNPGKLLSHLEADALTPIDQSADAARALLTPRPSPLPPPRVLDLTARLRRREA